MFQWVIMLSNFLPPIGNFHFSNRYTISDLCIEKRIQYNCTESVVNNKNCNLALYDLWEGNYLFNNPMKAQRNRAVAYNIGLAGFTCSLCFGEHSWWSRAAMQSVTLSSTKLQKEKCNKTEQSILIKIKGPKSVFISGSRNEG